MQVWANEECDDGNRLDYDGCSADCMHMDLWVSPCELEMKDIPNKEAILINASSNSILLSAGVWVGACALCCLT